MPFFRPQPTASQGGGCRRNGSHQRRKIAGRDDGFGAHFPTRRICVVQITDRQGLVTLPTKKSATGLQPLKFQAAVTVPRHVFIAAARKVRCVEAEVRWRWTLKVLKT